MASKVLLGKAGSDYGLFVSKTDNSGNTTPVIASDGSLADGTNLQFDSRVGIGSLPLKFHGQGQLGRPATISEATSSDTFTTITHNLGYKPYCIVQWCLSTDISSGLATKMYPAMHFYFEELDEETEGQGEDVTRFQRKSVGGVWFEVSNTTLKIYNNFAGEVATEKFDGVLQETGTVTPLIINYAFLIFDVEGVETE